MNGLRTLRVEEGWIAVEKPSGMLSVPGRGPEKADCVVSRAAAGFGWIREVHRLDQPTSGVMILARNPEAHRRLSRAFEERKVRKAYVAICAAVPESPSEIECGGTDAVSGRITLFQRLDPEDRPRQILDQDRGKEAVTLWRVLDSEPGRVRLELRPLTGRTHQLRLACASTGAPILGDSLYAPPEIAAAARRLMLHAAVIRFPDPSGGGRVEIESPPPF